MSKVQSFLSRSCGLIIRILLLLVLSVTLSSERVFGGNSLVQYYNAQSRTQPLICRQGVYSEAFSNTILETTAIITNGMAQKSIPGMSIALVEGTNIVWSQGFGYADMDNEIPAAPDTVYMLGSISKTLVTALLMDQYDDGLVSLDVSITNYISEFSMLPRFSGGLPGITVRRLLNHHSGVPGDIMNDMFVNGPYRAGWEDWLIAYLQTDYPAYAPGEIASYCNSAFVLVGEIVARTAGTNLNDHVADALFGPLGMDTSSFTMITNNLAMGYLEEEPMSAFNSRAAATGGAFTTVEDMAQFIMMMLGAGTHPNGTQIMQSNTLYQVMGSAEISSVDFDSYFIPGLGLDSVDDPVMRYAGRTWIKDGSTGNFNTLLEVLPDQNLGVILMANSDTAEPFKYHIVRQCLQLAVAESGGPTPSEPDLPNVVSITNAAEITGKYVTSGGYDEIAANQDGTLTWTVNAHSSPTELTLVPTNSAYMMEGYDAKFVFTNAAFNGSNYLVMVQYGSMGSEGEEYMFGSYVVRLRGTAFESAPITEAWSNRVGKTYIISNLAYDDAFWCLPVLLSVTETNGVLLLSQQGSTYVMDPALTNVAFRPGLSSRSDSCVRFVVTNNSEQIVFGGYQGEDISLIPSLTLNSPANGSVRYHENDWYRFTPESNMEYIFRVSTSDQTNRIVLILLDEELSGAVTNAENTLRWTSTNSSPVYLALAPKADAEYTLGVYPRSTPNDYDGDGKTDLAVFHQASGYWSVLLSETLSLSSLKLGDAGYVPVPGDFDGDQKADPAVYQESTGYWYILLSGSSYSLSITKLGKSGYTPVSGDYDADGKTDLAVYQESTGYWYILKSSTYELSYTKLGESGYTPVSGDYDGDGTTDPTVYHEASGYWYILLSGSSYSLSITKLGKSGYTPVSGDYDADGKTDLAVYRESTGYWYILKSSTYELSYMELGESGYTPVSGDYDGDGTTDPTVYHEASGYWYILLSGSSYSLSITKLGESGYTPVR